MSADGLVLAVDGGGVKTDLALLDARGALLSLVRGGRSQVLLPRGRRLRRGARGPAGTRDRRGGPGSARAPVRGDGSGPARRRRSARGAVCAPRPHRSGRTGPPASSSATTRWRCSAPAPTAAGGSRSCAAPESTASGSRRVGVGGDRLHVRPDSSRSGRCPATGAAVMTSVWPRSPPPCASADGRGPRTVLEQAVPSHFGLGDPFEVARAVHLPGVPMSRLGELAPRRARRRARRIRSLAASSAASRTR